MIVYYICCYWGLNLTIEFNCIIKLGRFKFWLIVNSYIDKNFNDEFYIGLITKYKGDLWHVEYEDGYEKSFDGIEVRVYNCIIHLN